MSLTKPQARPIHRYISREEDSMMTPFNTPAERAPTWQGRPAHGASLEARSPLGLGQVATQPQGDDARPPLARIASDKRGAPASAQGAGAGGIGPARGRPINAASAMKGRGMGGYTATPGNTPSSVERIGRRIASNLFIGAGDQDITGTSGGDGGVIQGQAAVGSGAAMEVGGKDARFDSGRIVPPSYERRFSEGLIKIDHRFNQGQAGGNFTPAPDRSGGESKQSTQSPAHSLHFNRSLADSVNHLDWPTSFSSSLPESEGRKAGETGGEGGKRSGDEAGCKKHEEKPEDVVKEES